ncbi:MAG TPA: hypothetical protein VHS97_01725 [Isosphaeraceae bacterium]|nr:hypothetical protein [Isosphaeraceae bacterium]
MPANVSEKLILDALHKVPQAHWSHVLEFLHDLEPKAPLPGEGEMPKTPTIAELLALSSDRRDMILEAQAALAEHDYRNDPELTAFEAFGPDDLYVDDTDTPAR